MANKLGRNEPCWCGSKVKYKKCHLNRSSAVPLTRDQFERRSKNISSSKKCSVSESRKHECRGNVVRAHTISKSGSLRQIAEKGLVMGTKPNLAELEKTDGRITLTAEGVSKASTFTGFCAHHDKSLFAPLEDNPITLSSEQLFLLAYRAFSRELYAKETNVKTAELLREIDKGRTTAEQIFIQGNASGYAEGVDLALIELREMKDIMDGMLASGNFSGMNHFVVELSALPKVLVSASTQPEFDFKGNRIQTFGSRENRMSHVIFNCVSYDNVGCFVFSWLPMHDEICTKFIETLAELGTEEIGDALIRFCYSTAENTWASPRWWNALGDQAKADVSERLQHGMLFGSPSNMLVPNGIKFGALYVEKTGYRRASQATRQSAAD